MAVFVPRIDALLKRLDELLSRLASMLDEQRGVLAAPAATAADAALLKQLSHAQSVIVARRRDLGAAVRDRSVDRLVHELWSLGGDMSHFDFARLPSAVDFPAARDALSMDALVLTRDLSSAASKSALVTELLGAP